ncbi:MAG: DUF2283 domain-containing protein [Geitlerinemataceae cyanobacterium]
MNVKYDAEADVLMFVLKDGLPVNAIAEPGGVIVSYGEDEEPLCVEFLNASQRELIDPSVAVLTVQKVQAGS